MRRILSVVSLFMIMLCSIGAEASYRRVAHSRALQPREAFCRQLKHPVVGGNVCTYMGDRQRNPDILYFFHGVNRTPEDWANAPQFKAMQEAWVQSGIGLPTVISVSFGERWLMTANDGPRPGVHHYFVNEIMAKLEAEVGGLLRGRRLLLGESMGGANAALLFAREQRLFERAAFVCPAMSMVSPFAPANDIEDYIRRNGAHAQLTRFFMGIARQLVGRAELWPANDSLAVSKLTFNRQTPAIYVSCGDRDELGFFEGAKEFATQAKVLGAPVLWSPLPGGHCANTDSVGVVRFFHTRLRR